MTMAPAPTRATMTGGLGFALVNVPIKVYAATSSQDAKFNQCHVHDDGTGHRINMFRRCSTCQAEVEYGDLVKGVEREDGTMLVISDTEIAAVTKEAESGFEILKFIEASEVDPIAFENPYYCVPDGKAKGALEGFTMIRTVMAEKGLVGLVRYSSRGKTHIATLRPFGEKAMVMQNIAWSDEVREPSFAVLDRNVELEPKQLAMARAIVDSMVGAYDPDEYTDESSASVKELIATKQAGLPVVVPTKAEAESEVGDLLERLEASIAAKEASKAAHPAGKKIGKPRKTAASKVSA